MNSTRILNSVIPLLAMAGMACATSAFAEGRVPPAGAAMEAGEIDAGTVQAGARVMVVHGRGERHPVSGEWGRLDTSAGYAQAVDVSTLILARGRDPRQQRIPLEPIQKPVMEGLPSGEAATDSTAAAAELERSAPEGKVVPAKDPQERGGRIARKLAAGAVGGVVGGFTGLVAVAALGSTEDCAGGDDLCGLGTAVAALFLGTAGYGVGAAFGVSRVDPHDQFIPALGGSAAGLIAGFYMTSAATILWPTLFAAPIITATMMSEWSRDPPEDQRLSIRLRPHPGGGMSAAATLAF